MPTPRTAVFRATGRSHAWTVAFAPYENPEIAVVAFVYNGTEGATVAGPIVRRVLEAYFELKNIDTSGRSSSPAPMQLAIIAQCHETASQ